MFSLRCRNGIKRRVIPLNDQSVRLLMVVVVLIVAFIATRSLLTPETFGDLGHYRTAAVDSIEALDIRYAGHQACSECHEDISEFKSKSFHREVNCECCHGPAAAHIESGAEILPDIPRQRDHCLLCHIYNPARPTGFPQIDPVSHNPVKPCIGCHNPHRPDPPETPNECEACHRDIYRTKALSPHAPLKCTVCHETPGDHAISPRSIQSNKPESRAVCAQCHAKTAEVERFIPRIDLETHGEKYLCWECHYPHFPEAN